jgi:hypothetical protein
MIVYRNDAVKFAAIYIRTGEIFQRLEKQGYGYVIANDPDTRFIAVYNGIEAYWIHPSDIIENFGRKQLIHTNVLKQLTNDA